MCSFLSRAVCFMCVYLGVVAFFVMGGVPDGHAQMQWQKSSTQEDVAIAFFKMAGIKPDFKRWVESSSEYQDRSLRERGAFLRMRMDALERAYTQFDPERNHITIGLPVRVRIRPHSDSENQDSAAQLTLYWEDEVYDRIPYPFQNQWLSIVMPVLSENWVLDLNAAEYRAFYEELKLYAHSGRDHSVRALILVHLLGVDARTPFVIDEVEQWLLYGEPMSISLWSATRQGNRRFIWRWRSPKHGSRVQSEINSLFR